MADGMVSKFTREVSWDYMYAGTIRWFQRRRPTAVAIWKSGLTCGYTFYRGLDCALLLWYASTRSKSFPADAFIERVSNPYFKALREGYFVDAIVRYIRDEIDEAEARRLARSLASWEHFNAANIAQLDFYIAAKAGARGNRHLFQKHMAACAAAEGMDHIIPELWIARYEAGMLPFQFPKGEYKAAGHPTKKVRRRRIES